MQKLILKLANKYNKVNKLGKIKKHNKLKLPKDKAFLISVQYENLKDIPKNKDVKKAYRQFKKELIKQYRLLSKYINFEFVNYDPYKNSQDMFKDIKENKRLKVYTGGEYHKNMKCINKIFRAVHDIFGHYIHYNSFSASGEYKAYKHHSAMFSPLAKKALFTESIGQVCYYAINKKYAKQKSILFNNHYLNLL